MRGALNGWWKVPGRVRRVAGWTALLGASLVAAAALVPIPPQFLAGDLDAEFAAALHFGAAHRYRVGTDLISTHGPLGFVYYDQYAADTYAWLLGFRAGLAAATCAALAWLGYTAWKSPWGAALAVLLCTPFLAAPDVWLFTLPLLALLIERWPVGPVPLTLRLALGAAIGLASLIKFTILLAALIVLMPLAVSDLLRRRRVSPLVVAALAAAVLAWLAGGQGAVDSVGYLDWSLREISSGYSEAMQRPAAGILGVHAILVSVVVVAGFTRLLHRRGAPGTWASALALSGLCYLLYRAGFVRADAHIFITVFGLLVATLLLVLLSARTLRGLAAGALLVAIVPATLWVHVAVRRSAYGYFRPFGPLQLVARLATWPLILGGDALSVEHERSAAAMRAAVPLPPLRGSVDIYPHDQAAALAHGLELSPRPVFQSYMAYSERLARANAEFVAGDRAPEWILFRVAPIDHRLPALDDSLSWPFFMTRYHLVGQAGDFALLRQRQAPLGWRLESLGRITAASGASIAVPPASAGPIWARIDVHSTLRDTLVGALRIPPVTYIQIETADGTRAEYRIVPAVARAGFVLSPLTRNTADFMRLMSRQPASDAGVTSISVQVVATRGFADHPRRVDAEFFRLVIDQ